jgi:quercetin dioxygenase-like cupin family protein
MKGNLKQNIYYSIFSLFAIAALSATNILYATEDRNNMKTNGVVPSPMVTTQIFEQAEKNENWKTAFATGKHAQVVFMNVSPETNPKNEIGMETHPFDQVIIVVTGKGKAVLNGKESLVAKGDMIFIPEGTPHNVINLVQDKPFKIISVYSSTDIPANSNFKKKSDAP